MIDVNSKCGEWAQSGGGRGFASVVTPTVTTLHTRSYFKLFNSKFIFTLGMFILTFLKASQKNGRDFVVICCTIPPLYLVVWYCERSIIVVVFSFLIPYCTRRPLLMFLATLHTQKPLVFSNVCHIWLFVSLANCLRFIDVAISHTENVADFK